MATQSILKNIVISEPKTAELFINALEEAAEIAEASALHDIECENIKGNDIKKFLGALVK